jgi:primosomal protein N' (replication factor Y) (superfamily II helicase)
MKYAEVAVNTVVHQTFHYHIPEALQGYVMRGNLVRVAFGTDMQPAIVVELHDELPPELAELKTKPIMEVLDPEPVMTEEHIELGLWMSRAYLTAPSACLWLMLPPGLVGKGNKRIHLLDAEADGKNEIEDVVLEMLRQNGSLEIGFFKKIPPKDLQRGLRALEKIGAIRLESFLRPPTVVPKTVTTVMRAIPEDMILSALSSLKRAKKQSEAFNHIALFDYPLDLPEVCEVTQTTKADLNALEKRGLIIFGERIIYRDSLADKDFIPSEPLDLTHEQEAVWELVKNAITPIPNDKDNPTLTLREFGEGVNKKFLLHGVTGSGKTEIYLQAIAATLAQGRQAIFLVPEIALTPQTIRRVAQRFPQQVAVVHGSLSAGERFDTWRRARDGEIGVIVGTRSALFTPLPDIGLIILDEEHDHSYKHQPPFNPPYYHAREVAEQLADLNDAILILGSATPDMETYFRAKRGDLQYLHMPNRITGHRQRIEKQAKQRGVIPAYQPIEGEAMGIGLPPVQIVDMREELREGNRGMFSRALHEALAGVIQRGEQAILFLNRRGQNSYVFCRDCGYRVDCKRCDMPMTYHRDGEAMRCHYCDNKAPVPTICPLCQSERIRYFGAGTQQVEQELFHAFPDVTTVRWDRDTADKPEDHEAILAQFAGGKVDVMVGTQMIAKGLDVPLVTLVGVVSADPGLALPDFRANERAFQLLTQVAGRAGRGVLGGKVILQTYNPEHPSILMASQHDYEGFYKQEIEARRELGYPPFRRLARILVQQANAGEAQRQIQEAAEQVKLQIERKNLSDTSIIGPAPCFFSRIDKQYRWQLLIRSSEPLTALESLQLRQGWYLEIDPVDIL